MKQRIGIFGGSFDPPHWDHVRIARAACKFVDKLLIVPAGLSPGKSPWTPNITRRKMAELLVELLPQHAAEVFPWEMNKSGPSYTYETIEALRALYKNAEISLILGQDSWNNFNTWSRPYHILDMVDHVTVFPRSNVGCWSKGLLLPKIRYVEDFMPDFVASDISSSLVRALVAASERIDGLVPDKIIEYIREYKLYKLYKE
jgi:nicotinate-nucleotide adenylyltransferase